MEVIKYAEDYNNTAAASRFKVDRRSVADWRKKKSQLFELSLKTKGNARKRLLGAGRKLEHEDLEDELFEWIMNMRARRLRVSQRLIQRKAKFMWYEQETEGNEEAESFAASNGWYEKFARRHHLSLRRTTHVAQKDPDQLVAKIVAFILRMRRLQKLHNYQPSDIIAMDETAVWSDMVSNSTVNQIGAREVSVRSTGHEKSRVSVCLTAKADGTKLKPFIVFKEKGAKRDIEAMKKEPKFKNKCVLATSSNAWMTAETTTQYVNEVIGSLSFRRRLFV